MRFILTISICVLVGNLFAQSPSVSVCNYLNNKSAAVSITFDDGCKDQFNIAQPIMDNLGFDATFFIITNYSASAGFNYGCTSNLTWSNLQNAVNHGHEIGSHTVHHTLLDSLYIKYGADTVESEIRKSRDSLNKYLFGQKVVSLAYPEGDGGDGSSASILVRKLIHKYYLGARIAGVCPAGYDTYSYAASAAFDDFYYQVESFIHLGNATLNDYTQRLDGAIQNAGWFLPMYHSFNQSDYLSVTTSQFSNHMNAINSRKNSLWIAPFGDVLKYHKERVSATCTISNTSGAILVSLTDTLNNFDFDMPLTLLVSNLSSDIQIDSIKQGNHKVFFKLTNGIVQFNAFPDRGNITIYKTNIVYSSPVLSSSSIISVTSSGVSIAGDVSSDGNSTVTVKGVCWSLAPHPSLSDHITSDGSGDGSFTSVITGLQANTTYYVRSYATNTVGTSYGTELSFTTPPVTSNVTIPVLSTNAYSMVTSSSALSGGVFLSDGNATITSKGVCWSTSPQPEIMNNKTNDGTGTGNFTSEITGLSPNTTYYVRAYAINSAGTGYGNQVSFTSTISTGLVGALLDNAVSVFPNPAAGKIYLSFESHQISVQELKIISSTGTIVYEEKLNGFLGTYDKEIYLNGLTSGIYSIEIVTEVNKIIRKLAIQ